MGPPGVAVPTILCRLIVPSVHSSVFGLSNRRHGLSVEGFAHFLRGGVDTDRPHGGILPSGV